MFVKAAAVQHCRRDQLFCSSAAGFITVPISVRFMEKKTEGEVAHIQGLYSLQETCLVTQFLLRDERTKTQRYGLDMPQTSYLIIRKVGYFGYIISESDQVGQPFRARYLVHQLLPYKILPLFF